MLIRFVSFGSRKSGGDDEWEVNTLSGHYGGDCAESGSVDDEEQSWLQTTVEGEGKITFWWKVYSEEGDYLRFYIDSDTVYQKQIDGEVDWQKEQFNVSGSGTHTLKWRYIKDSGGEYGDDGGMVDFVQWSGSPPPDPTNWDTITYTYDPAGRRTKKNVVGSYIVKYVYDGDHVIAEYDDSGLLRKYIYGARFDEPVCMIDVADNNKAYYYHFNGLGSVVALSNSNGDSCQSYEYSVYGQVAASDPNHPNPYMFTGRRFDIETGLYYYRARYYNPHIGRFMQTDPVGYGAGMNLYAYCANNPIGFVDPSGAYQVIISWFDHVPSSPLNLNILTDEGGWRETCAFADWGDLIEYAETVGLLYEYDGDDGPTISYHGAVPNSYNSFRDIAIALGASTNETEYGRAKADVTIENAEESLARYLRGFNGGEFDLAVEDPDGDYILDDGTVLNGTEFGNYLAGYAGYYHGGPLGAIAAAVGGQPYAIMGNLEGVIRGIQNGQNISDVLGNPTLGTWLDPERDQDLIKQGASAAQGKVGDVWQNVYSWPIYPPF